MGKNRAQLTWQHLILLTGAIKVSVFKCRKVIVKLYFYTVLS